MGTLLAGGADLFWAPRDRRCLTCADVVPDAEACVYWSAPLLDFVLHAACARDLGVSLVEDAMEACLANGRVRARTRQLVQSVVAGRVASYAHDRQIASPAGCGCDQCRGPAVEDGP